MLCLVKRPHSNISGWYNDFLLITHVRGPGNIFGDFFGNEKLLSKGKTNFNILIDFIFNSKIGQYFTP